MKTCSNQSTDDTAPELYDLYCYPNPAKEERRQQLLAEIPTDARDEENYGRTSLHLAAEFADCEAIASLLDRGAGVNDRDEEGHTPLFRLASRRSRVPALEEPIATAARLLLERGANLPRSARGTTALLEAVQNRHHAMAAVLIDSGQRLDSANSYGDSALHILCRRAADTAREIAGKERFIASFGERWVSESSSGRPARSWRSSGGTDALLCDGGAAAPQRAEIDPDEKKLGRSACVRPGHGGRRPMGERAAFG
ncbi:MAG: ankyrin repeat domain-containing protein [Alistipes inops]